MERNFAWKTKTQNNGEVKLTNRAVTPLTGGGVGGFLSPTLPSSLVPGLRCSATDVCDFCSLSFFSKNLACALVETRCRSYATATDWFVGFTASVWFDGAQLHADADTDCVGKFKEIVIHKKCKCINMCSYRRFSAVCHK